MEAMVVTAPVFQPEMAWLNAVAWINIPCIFVTPDTSHEVMSWLKALAPLNMSNMVVTG
jgi:hypothetical protein